MADGDEWLGTSYNSSGAPGKFRLASLSQKTNRLCNYLRNRHSKVHKPVVTVEDLRSSLSVAHFTNLVFFKSNAGPYLQCQWLRSVADPSLQWLRTAIPEGCLLVQLAGKPAARFAGDMPSALIEALKADSCLLCELVSPFAIAKEAHTGLGSHNRASRIFKSSLSLC